MARILSCFSEGPCCILQFSEIQQWCREHGTDDSNLQEMLQGLVDSGCIGCRTLTTTNTQYTIYWLKGQGPQGHLSASTSTSLHRIATPSSTSRLKRTRSKFVSPLISNKKPRLGDPQVRSGDGASSSVKGKLEFGCEEKSEESNTSQKDKDSVERLLAEKNSLEEKLREREEKLRKLKMVKMYRTKNDLQQLDTLTNKWREVSQEAAECLLASSPRQPPPSMAQMLDYLHIDHNVIHYSPEEEVFY